jgi:two-component system CheB/CheR fusion protein
MDLDKANDYLESILKGIHRGVVVVDRDFVVRLWNPWAEDLWGLRRNEVEGQHFANLDIGLPVAEVLPHIRRALEDEGGEAQLVVAARNRRGYDFDCQIICTTLRGANENTGVILVMAEVAPITN